jgi:outer membrane protein insertion porin family
MSPRETSSKRRRSALHARRPWAVALSVALALAVCAGRASAQPATSAAPAGETSKPDETSHASARAAAPPAPSAEPAASGAAPSGEPAASAAAPTPPAPTGPTVPETICQGRRISSVDVKGQGRVSSDDIRATLKLRAGLPCTDGEVTHDAQALWDLGYFRDVRVEGDPHGTDIALSFVVVERPAVGEVVYVGNDALDKSDIDEKVTLKPGGILSVPEVRTQVGKIKDLYADKGYFLAEVHYELADRPNNEVQVRFVISEGAQVSVRRIRFVGNDKLSDRELHGIMQTGQTNVFSFVSSSDRYKREVFDEDLNRLHALYYDHGYLTVEMGEPRIELTPDRRYVDVTIPIKEGPRFRVGRVRAMELGDTSQEIEPLPGRKKLRESIDLNPGDWFSRSVIAKNLQDITRYYRDRGYAKVEVAPDTAMHMDQRLVDIVLTIRRGPLVYVQRINVKGNTKTRDAVLRREARIVEGQLYSQTLVERSKERMTALGYFTAVNVTETEGSGPDKIIINFEVEEKPTGTFQLGAGFSSQETFLLNGQIQQENLFGRGQSLALNLQFSGIRQLAQLRFIEPYLFGTNWSSSAEIFKSLQARRDYNRDSTGGSMTFGHPIPIPALEDHLRLYATYRLEHIAISAPSGGAFGLTSGLNYTLYGFLPLRNLFNEGWTSATRLTLTWDTRNNRLFPSQGVLASTSMEIADHNIGSTSDFVRNDINLRLYHPIWGPFVGKLNTQWGLITSRDGKGVPIYERYFLGGILDVRGFPIQSLGPRIGIAGSNTDPTFQTVPQRGATFGGNMEFYYNLEIEFPIIESVGIKGVVFQDGGNAWNLEKTLYGPKPNANDPAIDPAGINSLRLRTSWGFGIRWFSPLGPLRFEWGFPLFRRKAYEDAVAFQFTVGSAF